MARHETFNPDENPPSLAESAFALVEADAAAAAGVAQRALELARSSRDAEAQAAALHALSFARRELVGSILSKVVAGSRRVGCVAPDG